MRQEKPGIALTRYSHGAGCGCKIAPSTLSSILREADSGYPHPQLLVGRETADDAAVMDMGDGTALISTTDFFMPIVDDPFTFGRIAAANAISDVYAMGGTPLLAISILGWPVQQIDPRYAAEVVKGGARTCREASIPLAGGHSIDSPEPLFGLAVTGTVAISRLKRNNTATPGCRLYLTKPLGVGILTTALKKGLLRQGDENLATDSMLRLNCAGAELAALEGVRAMTDVTGFGLLGHLAAMCAGSSVSATLRYEDIPRFPPVGEYLAAGCIPGGTHRNWESLAHTLELEKQEWRYLLCDPQTNGGLLVAVTPEASPTVEKLLDSLALEHNPIGVLSERGDRLVRVIGSRNGDV